jgi:radical SAM protein
MPQPVRTPTAAIRSVHHDPADRPFLVIWEATRACALACVHCRAEAITQRDPRELSTAEAGELMEQVRAFGSPPPIFVITGGDPFERDDLFELVRRGRQLGLPVAVSPSGTAKLTRPALVELQQAGATAISLSVDGATAAVHDGFRKIPGTFDRTLEAWRTAQEMGLKVQVNTTLGVHNLDQLPELIALVAGLRAMTWSIFLMVPMGRGSNLSALSPEVVEDVLNVLYDAGDRIPIKTTEGHHFRRVSIQRQILQLADEDPIAALSLGPTYRRLHDRLRDLAVPVTRRRRAPLNVNAGNGFAFISHLGSVHPSGFLPIAAGNVRDQTLPEIYRQSKLFTSLRDPAALTGRCGRCEFRGVCGGSRSRAYASGGDPLGDDPLCGYQPGSFGHQRELSLALGSEE